MCWLQWKYHFIHSSNDFLHEARISIHCIASKCQQKIMQQWLQLVFQQIPWPQLAYLGDLFKIKLHLICFYFSQVSSSADFESWSGFLVGKSEVTGKSVGHQLITQRFYIFTQNVTVAWDYFITLQVPWKVTLFAGTMYWYLLQFDYISGQWL